jgi:hypothetical protein
MYRVFLRFPVFFSGNHPAGVPAPAEAAYHRLICPATSDIVMEIDLTDLI